MERIVKTPGVCGGDACVGSTRAPVWLLQGLREMGAADEELLDDFPSLNQEDLPAVWEYVSQHSDEIRNAISRQRPVRDRTTNQGKESTPAANKAGVVRNPTGWVA